jgi:hypothetical protein
VSLDKEGRPKPEVHFIYVKISVPTSQRTKPVSIRKINRLMLHREIIGIYCDNHKKYINAKFCRTQCCLTYQQRGKHRLEMLKCVKICDSC